MKVLPDENALVGEPLFSRMREFLSEWGLMSPIRHAAACPLPDVDRSDFRRRRIRHVSCTMRNFPYRIKEKLNGDVT
jgi:hypothetical protein